MKNFKDKLSASISRMMIGRYGTDQLNQFIIYAWLGIFFISIIFGRLMILKRICSFLSLALLVILYFRMFSRNISRRSEENGKFIRIKYEVFGTLKTLKEKWVQRKDYKFFKCPACRTVLRVPRGHGKIKIVCRKCGNTFIGKS